MSAREKFWGAGLLIPCDPHGIGARRRCMKGCTPKGHVNFQWNIPIVSIRFSSVPIHSVQGNSQTIQQLNAAQVCSQSREDGDPCSYAAYCHSYCSDRSCRTCIHLSSGMGDPSGTPCLASSTSSSSLLIGTSDSVKHDAAASSCNTLQLSQYLLPVSFALRQKCRRAMATAHAILGAMQASGLKHALLPIATRQVLMLSSTMR